jgi:hypothetical protein
MDDIGVFSPEQARTLWQDYLTRQQSQPQTQANYPQRRPIDEPSPHRVFVRNDADEECPPYGCLQITGVDIVGGITVVTCTKPTSTDGEYLFNSPYAIASGGNGWAYRHGVVIALGNGTPPSAANVIYQPVVDTWTIEEGGELFTVFGEHNVTTDAVIGRQKATGGGGTKIISFSYSSAEPNSGAIVQIQQRSFSGPVFGSFLEGEVVIVYDTDGCYFNEPSVDLLGRRGKAVLSLVDAEAAALHFPDDYDPPEYYWQVLSLCCDSTTCESET